jgi:type 1 fimbria pilin
VPEASGSTEQADATGEQAQMIVPYPVDTTGGFGVPADLNAGNLGQSGRFFNIGSAIYWPLFQQTGPPYYVVMFRSLDGGNTWTPLDATNGPNQTPYFAWSADWNGADTITVLVVDGTNPSSGAMSFRDFTVSTGKWGAAYGAGGPVAQTGTTWPYVLFRPGGSKIVVYSVATPGIPYRIFAAVFSGSWGTAFSVDANMPEGANYAECPRVCLASGVLKVDYTSYHYSGYTGISLCHQEIDESDALVNFSVVLSPASTDGSPPTSAYNGEIDVDGTFVLPVCTPVGGNPAYLFVQGFPGIIYSPTWTFPQISIDPLTGAYGMPPVFAFDASMNRLHAVYVQLVGAAYSALRHLWTDDLTSFSSWSGETLLDLTATSFWFAGNGMAMPVLEVSNKGLQVGIITSIQEGSLFQAFFLGVPSETGCTPGPNPPVPALIEGPPVRERLILTGSTALVSPSCTPGPNPPIEPPAVPIFSPCWMMDIADQFGNPLVSSVPLITGVWPAANILAPYDYLGIGSAFIINQSGSAVNIPDSTNLGTQFQLLFDSNPGNVSSPWIVPLTNAPNQRVAVSLPINGGSVALTLRIYYNEGF